MARKNCEAVDDVSLEIHAGSSMALIGGKWKWIKLHSES